MGDLNELIPEVTAAISAIIQKPKMSEKLLSKPPFRFLHDVISAVTIATGFAEGLYNDSELDAAAITERQAKVDYLNKIINLVGLCTGRPIEIRAAKVVAGLEPECTNVFLLALAKCATNPSINNAAMVQRSLAGDLPGSTATEAKSESKAVYGKGKYYTLYCYVI
jgi:TRAF3-interacting protein 1